MAQECEEGLRKAEAQLEMNFSRDMEKTKKDFFRYIGQKKKMKENVPSPMSKTGHLATTDIEKAEALSTFVASIFTSKCSSHTAQFRESKGSDWQNEDLECA